MAMRGPDPGPPAQLDTAALFAINWGADNRSKATAMTVSRYNRELRWLDLLKASAHGAYSRNVE